MAAPCQCERCSRSRRYAFWDIVTALEVNGCGAEVVAGMTADQVAVSAALLTAARFEALTELNADADARERLSSTGLAPIHAAARAGNVAVVESLVFEAGVEPDAKDAHGRTPLHCVLMGFLMSDGEARPLSSGLDMEPRSRAVFERLRASDANRADLALRDECHANFAEFSFAREADLLETAATLVEMDAAVDVPDAMGYTPFDLLTTGLYLAGRYHGRIARRMFARIDVRYRDPWGMTPLMHAAVVGEADVIEALLARGADAMARCTAHHRTALHYAVRTRAINAVEVLRASTCLRAMDREWLRPADLARLMGAPARVVRALSTRAPA